jgi:diguanylate cyclase (GGDEF)-like protein
VDDTRFSHRLLNDILCKEGYTDNISAYTADEAFQVLRLHEPAILPDIDLILMDNVMPVLSGTEACEQIKKASHLKDIPIIMVTASNEVSSLKAAFNAGVTDFIRKPFNEIELLMRIRSALALKKEMDNRQAREKELLEITKLLENANKKLREISFLDGLTGIANRRYFDEVCANEWRRCLREKKPITLILADIDCFKAYNDNYGHQVGDECLKKVALAVKQQCRRPGDLPARYGGEEFIMLLSFTDQAGGLYIAQKLRHCVENLAIPHAYSLAGSFVTVSVGLATETPNADNNWKSLLRCADEALYRAKNAGRNKVVAYRP